MNKIPTIDLLEDAFQSELGWRRKEIASLYLSVISSKAESQSRAVRSAIVLTYAHLEGFVRQAARSYLLFVKGRNLLYKELGGNFLSLKLSKMVGQGTTKASYYSSAVTLLISELDQLAVLPEPEVISAKSNLNYAQFCEILFCININSTEFSMRENFFDEVLLERRNAIAHGEFRKPTLDDYLEIHNGVLDIIEKFEEILVRAAVNEEYRA